MRDLTAEEEATPPIPCTACHKPSYAAARHQEGVCQRCDAQAKRRAGR